MTKKVLRFAPSPTGYLHVGNIRTALFNYLQAKKLGGDFILRLDDTDSERSSQHFIDQIKRDLDWLGINWDRIEQQSLRIERYRDVLTKLGNQNIVYECFETSSELEIKRKKQQKRGRPPVYDREALKLSEAEKDALRNEMDGHWRFLLSGENVTWQDEIAGEINVRTSVVSDPILVKGNGQFLYTLASVIDDSDFGVTNVVRGIDHLTNTAVQIEIFRKLSAVVPVFGHHSLIVDSSGENFSKRTGSLSIKSLREAGIEPGAITTGRKVLQGAQEDVSRGGVPANLRDEILALLSGVRIINIDVPRTMQYKITEYNRNKRSVTATEKFFSLEDFRQRGPEVMGQEFRDIQDENLKVNKEFYQVLQDAQTMGVSEKDLKKIMRKRGVSARNANFLLKGKNIPYTGYDGRMRKRVQDAKKLAKDRGEEINKEYFYPKRLFKEILREYKKRSLKPEEQQPGIFERGLDSIKDLFSETPQQQTTQLADIQTPPLPNTPMPVVRTAQAVNPNTNLTQTQEALLSPEEKVIASRRV